MVKVWYEPPPGGPRSNLNRGAYYIESAMTPTFMKKLHRSPPAPIIMGFLGATALLCYIPLSKYLSDRQIIIIISSWRNAFSTYDVLTMVFPMMLFLLQCFPRISPAPLARSILLPKEHTCATTT
jgi:hypothetical protein